MKTQGKLRGDTLLWPKNDGCMNESSGCRSGIVVGWQDFDEGRASRTTICAAIIPDDLHGATGSSAGYDLNQVKDALRELSARCVCHNEREGCDSAGDDCETEHMVCSCCTCSCITSFRVIGRWEARWDGKTRQSRGEFEIERSREERELPLIISTSSGTWWQGDITTNSNDDDESDIFRELIWYHRLDGRTALGHYKLDGATPSVSFRHMLQRLSESSSITRELIDILERQPDEGPTTLNDYSDEDRRSVPSDYPGAFLSRLLGKSKLYSLTAITFANRFHSTPVVSQIPLLQGLYLLTRRLRMRNSSRTSDGSFEAREVRASKDLLLVSKIGRAIVDGIAGVLLGFVFVNKPNHILSLVESVWLSIHVRLLRENISWLETFPVGFKLNVPLTTNMGREILLVVSAYENALALAFGHSSVQLFLVRTLGMIGAIFGISVVSSLVFDTIRLSTLHIKVISGTFCKMFRALLYTQSSLWKLFRGKKLNPLRHRTDTLEYDSMQLLLGTMLFTICLFLFTTLLVYYAFFTAITLSIAGCGVLVWSIHIMILQLPLAEYLVRVLCPNRFPKTVYFSYSGDNVDGEHIGLHTSTLVSVPLPKGRVFATAYGPPFSRFFSKLPQFLGELFTGRPTTINETCLDSTTQ